MMGHYHKRWDQKMKKVFLTILIVLLVAPLVMAADVSLKWDSSDKADGYKIYQSTDNGNTWDSGIDVGNVVEHTLIGVADSGLVLLRVGAYNSNGEAISGWRGAWYNGDWMPPDSAAGLGIE